MTGTDTDTSMGHVTCVTAGYLYQPWVESGISPEPELYKCNTIPILVNIATSLNTRYPRRLVPTTATLTRTLAEEYPIHLININRDHSL